MVLNYPDQVTRTTADDDTGGTSVTVSSCGYGPAYSCSPQDFDGYSPAILIENVYCYFLSFVLFIVSCKGIIPHPCRDVRNDEVPYGFE